jgi:mRNA-degrading endonuclease RelE of RelBE toxin-antitoxin system
MKLDLSKESEKALLGMDVNTAGRMIKAMIKIPDGDVKRLEGHEWLYRLRVGKWRVLFYTGDDGAIIIKKH